MTEYLADEWDLNSDEFVAVLDEVTLWSAMFGKIMLDHLPLRRNIKVLDVGCGAGFPLLELAQRLGPSSMLYGIDIWDAAIRLAGKKIAARKIRNVEVLCADGASIPFDDAEFDLIVSNLGINNFEDPDGCLRECYRVIRRGGLMALTTNLRGHWEEFYNLFEPTLRELNHPELLEGLTRNIGHRTTVDQLSQQLESAGFTVRKVERERLVMRYADGSAFLNSYFIKLAFMPDWRAFIPAEIENEVFQLLEKKLNAFAAEKGILELTVPAAYIEAEKV